MTTIDSPEDFSMGRVVSRTFGALFGNIGLFVALSTLIMVPMLLLALFHLSNPVMVGFATGAGMRPGQLPQFVEYIASSFVATMICTYVLQAALVQGTIVWLNGERPTFGNSLSTGIKSFFPIVVIALLALLGMSLGFALLLVPGVILALMWSVAVPARVVERTGITESFGRSRALTKNNRGKIFLLFLMYWIVIMAITFGVRPFLGLGFIGPGPAMPGLFFIIMTWIEQIIFGAFSAVGIAAIYYELRYVKEGVGPQQLAAAFD